MALSDLPSGAYMASHYSCRRYVGCLTLPVCGLAAYARGMNQALVDSSRLAALA
jgi:hypothetical protein